MWSMERRVYHLALDRDWASVAPVAYEVSTLGVPLSQQGFIHCSFADQVQRVADIAYRQRSDVVLLEIDPRLLASPLRVEALDGTEAFPHIYGPLNRDAVVRESQIALRPDGRLDVTAALTGT